MKRKVWYAVLAVCLAVLIFCGGTFVYDYYRQKQGETVVEDYTNSSVNESSKLIENPINFMKLQNKNADIFSWIRIKNTNIDYPILVPGSKGNDYYLRRNIEEEYDRQGVIFIENNNKSDWSDPVTVVYGHNIWTMGTMFYQLHKFEDSKFFNKNRYIEIYAPGRALKYEIYSAFEYDDRHILNSFDFSKKEVYQEFIDYTLDPHSLNKNIKETTVTTDDKIIVLSTCIKDKENSRYLVVGVLREDEKTK